MFYLAVTYLAVAGRHSGLVINQREITIRLTHNIELGALHSNTFLLCFDIYDSLLSSLTMFWVDVLHCCWFYGRPLPPVECSR